MSGITGIVNLNGNYVSSEWLKAMTNVLKHRGPHGKGYFIDKNIGLGHRQLSAVGSFQADDQPMSNEDDTIWMTSDGQIYNFVELGKILKSRGHKFKSDTSTEVILHAYEEYGTECLQKFNGMFAFSIWDGEKGRLFCARDRFGEKPFYYYMSPDNFYFASEIKSIIQNINIKREPNKQVISHYLLYGCVDHLRETFFMGIKRLLPAHFLLLDSKSKKIDIKRYWDLSPCNISKGNGCSDKFHKLFEDSIELSLYDNAPAGVSLSGGLDSSSIACVANNILNRKHRNLRLKTFSVYYEDKILDESKYTKSVIKRINAENYYMVPKAEHIIADIHSHLWHQEEPTGSAGSLMRQYPMKLAKENNINVLLLGSGGDEVMGGYPNLYSGPFFVDLIRSLQIRNIIREFKLFSQYHSKSFVLKYIARHILRTAFSEFFMLLFKSRRETININSIRFRHIPTKKFKTCLTNSIYDTLVILPTELRIGEKSAMAHSVELRCPFLDHRLVEWVHSLPNSQKIKNGLTKALLRESMKDILPEKVRNRPDKQGFRAPQDRWYREIADWIWEIIGSESFKSRGIFNVERVKNEFEAFRKGKKDSEWAKENKIWKWISVEIWYRVFIDEKYEGKS